VCAERQRDAGGRVELGACASRFLDGFVTLDGSDRVQAIGKLQFRDWTSLER
jgi:hypothetical protein